LRFAGNFHSQDLPHPWQATRAIVTSYLLKDQAENNVQNIAKKTTPNRLVRVRQQLVQWRLWILGFLWLGYVLIELVEHAYEDSNPYLVYLAEFVLLVSLPIVGSFLIDELLHTVKAKNRTVKLLDLKHDLSSELASATDWYSLSDQVLQFSSKIVPYISAALLVYDPMTSRYETISERKPTNGYAQSTDSLQLPEVCHTCPANQLQTIHPIGNNDIPAQHQDSRLRSYCLPLMCGDGPLARLHFSLPRAQALTAEQSDLLNNLASDMAVALATAQQRQAQSVLEIDRATLEERRLISRDLHDTLGQNLSYLRLQLDQFTREDTPLDALMFRTELEQMLDITTESYELVRGTLAILHNEGTLSLISLLREHGRIIADRAGFKLKFSQRGQPRTLRPELTRQIYYIFSEAVRNAEKHAAAQEVKVKLLWGEHDLTLQIADNGRGFEPGTGQSTRHFGLKIMRDRTESYGGAFNLQSAPGRGTRIAVQIPYDLLPASRSQIQTNQEVQAASPGIER
jgi:signal transduction histidine kinase